MGKVALGIRCRSARSEAWYSVSEHLYPGFLEVFVIIGLLRPSCEELLHASVQDIGLESHGALQESVCNEPHDEDLVAHEEAIWMEDGTRAAFIVRIFQSNFLCLVVRCMQRCVERSGKCQNSKELSSILDVDHKAESGDETCDRCVLTVV